MTGERVELFLGGQQVDISADVRYDPTAVIRRGRADYQSAVEASTCDLTLDNASGTYMSRNPLGTHYGLLGRNTPLRVAVAIFEDPFDGTTASGWGTGWTVVGTASEYAEGSGVATVSLASVNVIRSTYLTDVSERDVVVSAKFKPGVVATGAGIDQGLIARRVDASNYYSGRVIFWTTGQAWCEIYRHVAGTATLFATSVLETHGFFTYTASTQVAAELVVVGNFLRMRAYDLANPADYAEISTNDTAATAITAAGSVGTLHMAETGNTNGTISVETDDYLHDDVRFTGEVPSWPVTWDPTARNVQTAVQPAGILRRLRRGSKKLQSCYRRYLLSGGPPLVSNDNPLNAWLLEDESGSTQAEALFGATPGRVIGDFSFAAAPGPGGMAPLPSISASGTPTAGVRLIPDAHTFDTAGDLWKVLLWFRGTGTNASCAPLVIGVEGELSTWRLTVENTGTPTVELNVYSRADIGTGDVLRMTCTVNADVLDGDWHLITLWAHRNTSTTTQAHLRVDGDDAGSDFDTATATPGRVIYMQTPSFVAQSNITTAQAGGVQFYTDNNVSEAFELAHMEAAGGFAGETAAARMQRLADEEGLAFALIGVADDTEPMGPQRIGTLIELFDDGANTDMGILYDPRQFLGLAYRTGRSLYNQPVRLGLDYTAGHFHGVPQPVEDEQKTRNDVTVTRLGGSSARSVQETGPLNVQDPDDDPDGVGVYEYPVTLVPQTDAQLADLAGWARHLGTVDEPRYPSLHVQLHANTALIPAARRLDPGDLLTVANLPSAFLPPDTVAAIVQGYTETLNTIERDIIWQTSPASPYTIAVVESMGSELAVAVNSSATTMNIASTGTSAVSGYPAPRWTTAAADLPITAEMAGEQLTVTGISNGTWSFIGAGAGASDGNAAGTATITPALHASTAAGDLILAKASIRNSGAGVPSTPAGWIRLPVYPADSNVQIFARIAPATPTAPLISFTGGVANATLVGQCATFRSSTALYDVNNLLMHKASVLNASAADITYPDCPVPEDNCLVIYSGWRAQDWTSVATVAGATEIGEPDDGAGDNAGIVWDYLIQTSKADIAGGVFTVTGGVSGISRGAVFVLRCDIQTFTVTRSVNGVTKSQVLGEELKLWTPSVIGL